VRTYFYCSWWGQATSLSTLKGPVINPRMIYDLVRSTGAMITTVKYRSARRRKSRLSVAFVHRKSHKNLRGIETQDSAVRRWQTAWAMARSITQCVQQNSASLATTFRYFVSDAAPQVYARWLVRRVRLGASAFLLTILYSPAIPSDLYY
jgi:hypothetical protein